MHGLKLSVAPIISQNVHLLVDVAPEGELTDDELGAEEALDKRELGAKGGHEFSSFKNEAAKNEAA